MRPHQGSRDAHVDAIDLTLSSPEPEVRPQPQLNIRPQQQQRAPRYKQEPENTYKSVHNGNGYTQSGKVPQQQPRQVNPQHVKQIIDTSSPRALRHVVLQLCKTSPALSGAIARGLAPHSAYAQALIRGQQAKSHTPTAHKIKGEHSSTASDAYRNMNRRLGPSSSTHDSISRPYNSRPPAVLGNPDGLRTPSSQTATRVKREYQASPTDSEDSTNILDFTEVEQGKLVHEPRTLTPAGASFRYPSTAHLSAEGLAVRHRTTQNHATNTQSELCLQCGDVYKEGEIDCYFHPGHEVPTGVDDISEYSCCRKFLSEPGCTLGRHTSEGTGTLISSKRPSPALCSGAQHLKKPRVL